MELEAAQHSQHFTYVDGALIVVLLGSCLIGLVRGFTREFLGIVNWVGAIFLTLYGFPLLSPMARSHISNPFIADIGLYIVLFIVSLVVLSSISRFLSNQVKGSILGGVDRSLGMIFGLVRTFILMAVTFGLVVYLWPHQSPAPFKGAQTYGLFKQSFEITSSLLPKDLAQKLKHAQNKTEETLLPTHSLNGALDKAELVNKLSNLQIMGKESNTPTPPTYNEEQRSTLKRLIMNHSDTPASMPSSKDQSSADQSTRDQPSTDE